jgi:hypothetical protein
MVSPRVVDVRVGSQHAGGSKASQQGSVPLYVAGSSLRAAPVTWQVLERVSMAEATPRDDAYLALIEGTGP